MRCSLYIAVLVLAALACGVQTQAPPMLGSIGTSYQAPSPSPSAAPVPEGGQVMVVTALEAVYIRPSAGTQEEPVGVLKNGDVVIVTSVEVIGDSFWCRHLDGWTNCRYLAPIE